MAMCGPVPGEYSIHRVKIWHQLRITHSGNDPLAATEATVMVMVATESAESNKCTATKVTGSVTVVTATKRITQLLLNL